ncbi:MAG: outer membrane beta-barrel protein [Bacteroidia bacterium]|nr:outer membrane beta-barrel protein [Bacteroidia bacterium]
MNNVTKSLKVIAMVCVTLLSVNVHAQGDYFSKIKPAKKLSVGLNFGLTNSYTDAPQENSGNSFGLGFKYSVSHSIGIRASFNSGTIAGDRSEETTNDDFSFKNSFSTIDLSAVFTLGNVSFLRSARNLQYFATIGLGSMSNDATGKNNDPSLNSSYDESEVFVPIGFGLKYNLNDNFDIGLNTQFNFTTSDNIDAFNYDVFANKANDYFTQTGITLSYKFGTDKSQTSHLDWINPVESIYNDIDSINKNLKTLMADSDGDGVGDYFDKDNETPDGVKTYGDGTSVDTDGDGVPDSNDKEIFSLVTDVDADGVAKDDDGDGVPNELDADNNTAPGALVDAKGNAIELKEFSAYDCDNMTLPTIMFDNGSSRISSSSYASLYTLAEKMRMCPSLSVTATGYTRSKSGERLAMKRANSIIDHLEANYGVERGRISLDYTADTDVDYASKRIDFTKTGK